MFAEDGVFAMSQCESLGFAWCRGRDRIEGFFKFVRDLHPDMDFHDLKVVCETRNVVVAEFDFATRSSKTARVIHEPFVGRGLAIYTKGFADDKIPEERVA